MARIYTDGKRRSSAALGQAKLAMPFQIPSQASLHGIVKTHRSLALRAALLLRFALGNWKVPGERERHNVAIGLPRGEVFCKSIRKQACECLFKTTPAFVQRINSGFSGASNSSSSVLIRAIRG